MTRLAIQRLFAQHCGSNGSSGSFSSSATSRGAVTGAGRAGWTAAGGRGMDFAAFCTFCAAWEQRHHPAAVRYFFPVLDLRGCGYISQVGACMCLADACVWLTDACLPACLPQSGPVHVWRALWEVRLSLHTIKAYRIHAGATIAMPPQSRFVLRSAAPKFSCTHPHTTSAAGRPIHFLPRGLLPLAGAWPVCGWAWVLAQQAALSWVQEQLRMQTASHVGPLCSSSQQSLSQAGKRKSADYSMPFQVQDTNCWPACVQSCGWRIC